MQVREDICCVNYPGKILYSRNNFVYFAQHTALHRASARDWYKSYTDTVFLIHRTLSTVPRSSSRTNRRQLREYYKQIEFNAHLLDYIPPKCPAVP